ncbi:uncharacterized protein B0T23DRAFT_429781 [Neurospora hispaniola]|uniref:Uncharacterized protein n=1 Tax=Neurospora hispaniola TaxID=588809 RepID=A0AAJ0MQI2_9PEZI|nr:hypothetical protein B0T23DRAFT_429781 [Neurospora hispaniola]
MEERKHRLDSYFTARRQQPTNVVEDDILKHPYNDKVCAGYTVKPAQVNRYPATSIILE